MGSERTDVEEEDLVGAVLIGLASYDDHLRSDDQRRMTIKSGTLSPVLWRQTFNLLEVCPSSGHLFQPKDHHEKTSENIPGDIQ